MPLSVRVFVAAAAAAAVLFALFHGDAAGRSKSELGGGGSSCELVKRRIACCISTVTRPGDENSYGMASEHCACTGPSTTSFVFVFVVL
jgi:hypothetical protein